MVTSLTAPWKKHQDLQVGLELEEEVVGLRRRGQAMDAWWWGVVSWRFFAATKRVETCGNPQHFMETNRGP